MDAQQVSHLTYCSKSRAKRRVNVQVMLPRQGLCNAPKILSSPSVSLRRGRVLSSPATQNWLKLRESALFPFYIQES
jgi:hypothetical protein